MLVSRKTLITDLEKKFDAVAINRKELPTVYNKLRLKYGVPTDIAGQYIANGRPLIEATPVLLFYFTDCIGLSVDKYFTAEEIKSFSSAKIFEETKSLFPIVLENFAKGSLQEDQWMGYVDIHWLMKHSNLINYNINTQRVMEHVIRKGNEKYRIALNKGAVNEIMKAMEGGTYIPDVITLNLPTDSDFSYSNGVLRINELNHFDIIDGYHRYIAMTNLYNLDNTFNYEIGLRITYFDEQKAQQFIYQQDQKTKMKKLESDTMNQSSVPNIIIGRINQSMLCEFQEKIGRNNSIISSSYMSTCIQRFFFRGVKEEDQKKRIDTIKSTIIEGLNFIAEVEPSLKETKWTYYQVFGFIFALTHCKNKKNIYKAMNEVVLMCVNGSITVRQERNVSNVLEEKITNILKDKGLL